MTRFSLVCTVKRMGRLEECTDAPMFSLNGLECNAKIVSCYDGDTVHALLEVFGTIHKFRCRLANIDTPEIRTKNENEKKQGVCARDILSSMILNKIVRLKCYEFEKYGRLLIDVYLPVEGQNDVHINEWMVTNGYAHVYNGKTKQEWIN